MTRPQIAALILLAALTWGAWLLFAGVAVGIEHLRPFSLTVTVLMGAVTLFNLYIWRWPFVRTVFAQRPVLIGAWRVEIESSVIDEATGRGKTIEAYYLVRQTYLHISIRAFTSETTSKTQAAQLVKSDDSEWTLQGTFLDTPDVSVRDRSAMHYGAFWLLLTDNPVTAFRGQYWTDRNTNGTVRSIAHRSSTKFGDFESAARLFGRGRVIPR